ncbi:hypothetical protein [Corynebacterium accolens]|uniref:hypothetical protein n=1 Tax=Corynebacterium accolens TaxID=38284 RepID=UPI002542C2D5|nr:hypothetical protein [Corynebacterium accolens]MDK4336763.1 hypothetical protein [Corynebacterium accolens]
MGVLVFAIIEGPDLGWWEPQSSFSIFGWTWPENAAILPVPVALAVSAVGFAPSAMAIGAFFSGAAARRVAARYGAPGAVVQALSEGMTNAPQWSLVAATAFLALGFVGALRVRRAAGEKCAPASNADLGARVNRVQN